MNKTFLLFFVCACLIFCNVKCKRCGGGRSGGCGIGRGKRIRREGRQSISSSIEGHDYPSAEYLSRMGGSRIQSSRSHDSLRDRSVAYNTAPQIVYIQQYRNSESRYGNLLAGLALYNLGRSHGHHYHHYYEDDYHKTRYRSATHRRSHDVARQTADCYLRVEGDGRGQRLTVPCEIVSTFMDDSEKVPVPVKTTLVCKNVTTAVKIPSVRETTKPYYADMDAVWAANLTGMKRLKEIMLILDRDPIMNLMPRQPQSTKRPEWQFWDDSIEEVSSIEERNETHIICKNETNRINQTSIDPLTQKGEKVRVTPKMKCTVEIETSESLLRRQVDCKALEVYSRMPEPKEENDPRLSWNTTKSWINSLPWWMSMFQYPLNLVFALMSGF